MRKFNIFRPATGLFSRRRTAFLKILLGVMGFPRLIDIHDHVAWPPSFLPGSRNSRQIIRLYSESKPEKELASDRDFSYNGGSGIRPSEKDHAALISRYA